jgi:pimeloyl-ACP methyl ester carboxylesterase
MDTQFLQVSGGKIAYDVAGSGPLVICVPSMGDLRAEYRFLAPRLVEAGYRVARMDVRGHGESSTGWADVSVAAVGSDILALIHHLDAGPAAVIGTSMAAGAAVWAAAEDSQAVRSLTLIGPFVRSETIGMNRNTAGLYALLFAMMFARPWGPAMWKTYYNSLYPSRKPDDFAAYTTWLRSNLSEPGRMEALQGMLRAGKSASQERLPRVSAPTLVIMGSKDPDFKDPAAEAGWVAGALRGVEHILPGAGHYPHAEYPAETAAVILPFLESLR